MQKEFQTKLEKYQKEVTDKTPANIRQRREAELQELQTKVQQSLQDNEQAFRQAQQTKFKPVQDKIMAALELVLKEGNYVYAIDEAMVQV